MRKVLGVIKYLIFISIFFMFIIAVQAILKDEENHEAGIKNKIVLISHVYSNPYWQDIREGAEEAAKEKGVIVEFQGPDYASVQEGIRLINMAYAANVSGIITYVQDEDSYNSVINKIVDADIPIITIDSDAEKSKRLAYVGTDNVNAGKVGAEEMIKEIGIEGDIGIIMGGKEVKNQIERVEGFTSYLSENSNLKITNIESSDSYLLQAELVAKKILTDNSNIKAIFCTSAQDGIGTAKVIENMGLTGQVKIICFDDLPETLKLIKEGVISATISQSPYDMGYKAVNTILNIIEGHEVEELNLTDVIIINAENINQFN